MGSAEPHSQSTWCASSKLFSDGRFAIAIDPLSLLVQLGTTVPAFVKPLGVHPLGQRQLVSED
jgi:hypothetical protein